MRVLRKLPKLIAILAFVATALILLAQQVFRLPDLDGRIPSYALGITADTTLGAKISPLADQNSGLSGVYPLFRGAEAYAARVVLARSAEQSIDARYYIWQNDNTGLPLLQELRLAAERGVRVRLLVDDNGTSDLDGELAALNQLENFEVRVFNPFNLRDPRLASYFFDFFRLNRRMHNKSFTVDSAVTIIGGRNIGDIYFSFDAETQYSDFDLMLMGDAAQDVDADFDLYWNSLSAYPHELLVQPDPGALSLLQSDAEAIALAPEWGLYLGAIQSSKLITDLVASSLQVEWVEVALVSDDPPKGLGKVAPEKLMLSKLTAIIGDAEHSIDLLSAYFIPGDAGTDILTAAAQSGVRVRTLTNSLEATDVLPVHAGYTKYRAPLLDAGVEVYEMRKAPGQASRAELGFLGSSAASLHAKTFVLDADRVFVGSFNFDPRSAFLNCEMGFLVHSKALATHMTQRFDTGLETVAWQVVKSGDGRLEWHSREDDGASVSLTTEPGSSATKRMALWVIGLLPVEWML